MKGPVISFLVGLFVGVTYGLIRVKGPAPATIALLGCQVLPSVIFKRPW